MDDQVLVKGKGEARSLPDRALLRVNISGEGSSRDSAYEQAAADASAVDAVLERHRVALDHLGTAALFVLPKYRYRKGESVRTGWEATRSTSLEVVDLSILGELVAELAKTGGDIDGPIWQLNPDNPAHATARREAAADARRRADDYAAALGLVVEGVVWASEPGLRTSDGGPRGGEFALAASASGPAADEEDVIDVTPGNITVKAFLEVAFDLARPDAL